MCVCAMYRRGSGVEAVGGGVEAALRLSAAAFRRRYGGVGVAWRRCGGDVEATWGRRGGGVAAECSRV